MSRFGVRNDIVVIALVLAFGCASAGIPLASAASVDPESEETAVVDRFEGDIAVLVFDSGILRTVDRSRLPPAARHVDSVVHVLFVGDVIVRIRYDAAETRERRVQSQNRFDRLAQDPSQTWFFDSFGFHCGYGGANRSEQLR